MFLNWIKQLVKNAVLQGFREAVEDLELAADANGEPDTLDFLKSRMNALPAPSANGDGKSGRKSK